MYTSKHLMGIEVELYCIGGSVAVETYRKKHDMTLLEVTNDESLNEEIELPDNDAYLSGAEIRFNKGIPRCEMHSELLNLQQIATAPELHPHFGSEYETEDDPTEYKYTGPCTNILSDVGDTGLHVHFDVPTNYNVLDLLRLAININARMDDINRLAWREMSDWAQSPADWLTEFISDLRIDYESHTDIIGGKGEGVNMYKIYNPDCHTIEFRFAHASLITDLDAFDKYLQLLISIWDESFTGESTLEYEGFKLEIAPPIEIDNSYEKLVGTISYIPMTETNDKLKKLRSFVI